MSDASIFLVVWCPAVGRQANLRGTAKLNGAPLPTTEFAARKVLRVLHAAFASYAPLLLPRERSLNGAPIGCEVNETARCLLILYKVTSADDFTACFSGHGALEGAPSIDEVPAEWVDGTPRVTGLDGEHRAFVQFPVMRSHCGDIPAFPPLCVLLGVSPFTDAVLPRGALAKSVLASARSTFPCSMWHYSRFPLTPRPIGVPSGKDDFSDDDLFAQHWCCTYLFYSSHEVEGPVSLYPMLRDGTLRNVPPHCSNDEANREAVKFFPHFEEFKWIPEHFDTEDPPLSVFAFGEELFEVIIRNIVLNPDFSLAFRPRVAAHGLSLPEPLTEFGLEKLMALVLWFSCIPGVVGFTYSHTFSTVSEPNTLCLTGSAASFLQRPVAHSVPARVLLTVCQFLDGNECAKEDMALVKAISASVVSSWIEVKCSNEERIMGMADDSKAEENAMRSEVLACRAAELERLCRSVLEWIEVGSFGFQRHRS